MCIQFKLTTIHYLFKVLIDELFYYMLILSIHVLLFSVGEFTA